MIPLGLTTGWQHAQRAIRQLKNFGWTLLALGGALAWAMAGRRAGHPSRWPYVLALAAGVKFLLVDIVAERLDTGAPAPVTVVANLEVLTALLVGAGVAGLIRAIPLDSDPPEEKLLRGTAHTLALLILLAAGTQELDRAFHSSSVLGIVHDPALGELVAVSIYWSLFAVTAVVAGFGMRHRGLRYFGLALFAGTLLKVVLTCTRSNSDTGSFLSWAWDSSCSPPRSFTGNGDLGCWEPKSRRSDRAGRV